MALTTCRWDRGPCLDDIANGLPAGGHAALGDAAAEGCFLQHICGVQTVVELGLHNIALLSCMGADLLECLSCVYFDTHCFGIRVKLTVESI